MCGMSRGPSRGLRVGFFLTMLAACASSGPEKPGSDAVVSPDPYAISDNGSATCPSPAEGCPCSSEGAVAVCKGPPITVGDYTSCEPGQRSCDAGSWGPCVAKTVRSK